MGVLTGNGLRTAFRTLGSVLSEEVEQTTDDSQDEDRGINRAKGEIDDPKEEEDEFDLVKPVHCIRRYRNEPSLHVSIQGLLRPCLLRQPAATSKDSLVIPNHILDENREEYGEKPEE